MLFIPFIKSPYACNGKVALQREASSLRTLVLVSDTNSALSAFLPNARIHTVDADVLRLPNTRIRIPEYRLMNPSLPPSLLARLGIRNAAERKGTHFSEMISFVLRYAPDYLVSVSSPPISEIGGRGRLTQFSPPPKRTPSRQPMLTMTTATRPPSRWSIMNAGQEHSRWLEMPRPRLFGDVPSPTFGSVRYEYYGWGLWGGFRGEFPITNCLSATPLSVGAFATKVNTRKRARNATRFLEDGWARPKKLLEGQNGRKEGSGWMQPLHSATALFFVLRQFSNVGSQLRPS